jgi:hypothetical protein
MGFYLYKGLKKPLVLFGLKDKYIYYAMGCVALGLVLSGVLGSFMGIWGTLLGLGIGALGFWGMFKIQDSKGLYNKTKNNDELHIFPKRFNIKKFKSKNKNEK